MWDVGRKSCPFRAWASVAAYWPLAFLTDLPTAGSFCFTAQMISSFLLIYLSLGPELVLECTSDSCIFVLAQILLSWNSTWKHLPAFQTASTLSSSLLRLPLSLSSHHFSRGSGGWGMSFLQSGSWLHRAPHCPCKTAHTVMTVRRITPVIMCQLSFTHMISFEPHNNLVSWVLLSPSYWWRIRLRDAQPTS